MSNWQTIRPRLAPIARRTAISFWRALPRASCRLATLGKPAAEQIRRPDEHQNKLPRSLQQTRSPDSSAARLWSALVRCDCSA